MSNSFEIDKASTAPTVKALNEATQALTQGFNMSNSNPLTIAGTSVRQIDGLYSLNDLHKASGAEAKHQPGYFMRRDETQALIAEVDNSPDSEGLANSAKSQSIQIKEGRGGGTYACKELVIAYAAWISPAFHLKVIRVFLDVIQPQSEPVQMRLDYDRISPAQAQDLKEIVAAIVQAGVQTYGETWKRFQNKYQVNSYLELPATQHLEARRYLIAKLPKGYAGDAVSEATKPSALPRLQLRHLPPAPGTYRFDPANPYPATGRTIEVAKCIVADIRIWSDNLPGSARQDLYEAVQVLNDLLVSGWTEVDEALGQMHTAMHMLNRWQGRGGRAGNTR